MNAFQVDTIRNGQNVYAREESPDYVPIWQEFNEVFNIGIDIPYGQFSGNWGTVYLYLKKINDKGRLASYGRAHLEPRQGMHYFWVESDYEKLKQAFDSINSDPSKLKDFIGVVFNWEGIPNEEWVKRRRGRQNLVEYMKMLLTYSPESMYREVKVS